MNIQQKILVFKMNSDDNDTKLLFVCHNVRMYCFRENWTFWLKEYDIVSLSKEAYSLLLSNLEELQYQRMDRYDDLFIALKNYYREKGTYYSFFQALKLLRLEDDLPSDYLIFSSSDPCIDYEEDLPLNEIEKEKDPEKRLKRWQFLLDALSHIKDGVMAEALTTGIKEGIEHKDISALSIKYQIIGMNRILMLQESMEDDDYDDYE